MRKFIVALVLTLALVGVRGSHHAAATHAWVNYHWARASNPFTVVLGDNTTADWQARLQTAAADWTTFGAGVVTAPVGPGGGCVHVPGQDEVCNGAYGPTGWLGLASIRIDGDGHILSGIAQLNDSYFAQPAYSDPTLKQQVICQEVGHTFGLDHQPDGADSCMASPWAAGFFPHPNAHDSEQLNLIYAHLDGTPPSGPPPSGPPQPDGEGAGAQDAIDGGYVVDQAGGETLYQLDYADGTALLTWVLTAG